MKCSKQLRWVRDEVKKKLTHRGGIRFYISKSGRRKLDNMRFGSRDSYYWFTFEDVLHYMTRDFNLNTCFLAMSSVFTQVTATAIGISCSAQVPSIVLIFRERTRALPSMLAHTLWVRYRYNFLVMLALPGGSERDVGIEKMF